MARELELRSKENENYNQVFIKCLRDNPWMSGFLLLFVI
jgi:hypothetical protein